MTIPASSHPDTTERAERYRCAHPADRACFWRLAIGGAGLFWVCAMIWLVGALNP